MLTKIHYFAPKIDLFECQIGSMVCTSMGGATTEDFTNSTVNMDDLI